MPTPVYNYLPTYGFEQYLPDVGANGGASVSGDNLVITMWDVDAKNGGGGSDGLDFLDLLVPKYASDGETDDIKPAFAAKTRGRLGASMFLDGNGGLSDYMCAVLQPPDELKEQLRNSVVYKGGDPTATASYTFKKSHMMQFMWKTLRYTARGSSKRGINVGSLNGGEVSSSDEGDIVIGSYIPINIFGSTPNTGYISLLKTNGADGQKPQMFNMETADGAAECIEAVNKGDFFIPMAMDTTVFEGATGSRQDIWWPGSLTRG